jgi:DNA-binding CsgD family transcriptional regulator
LLPAAKNQHKGRLLRPAMSRPRGLGIMPFHIIDPPADLLQASVHDTPWPAPGPTRQKPWSARCEHGHSGKQKWRTWNPGENDSESADRHHHPSDIARQVFDSQHRLCLVAPHDGIRPADRRRSRLALTLAEREVSSRGITTHRSARSIARLLGRSPSTVSREMSRNGGYDRYRATLADENAWARARRPKCCKLANSPRLRRSVAAKLRLDWSPEQIAGWLKRTHPEDECNQVSHETIYRSLFAQTRGVLKKELLSHLRSKRSMRRSKPVEPAPRTRTFNMAVGISLKRPQAENCLFIR